MVDFRAGYVPPGVYVTPDSSSVSSAVGALPTVILLVGTGLGYRTNVDHGTITASTGSLSLSQQGIANDATLVVSSTVNGVTTTYTLTTDYTVSQTGSGNTATTTVTRVSNGSLPQNQQLDIAYHYADASYFAVNQFSDYATFASIYGAPFDASGNIQSSLSLAAQIAFENGAGNIYAVALNPNVTGNPSLAVQFNNAYALSSTIPEIDLIVPIFDSTSGPSNLASTSAYVSGLASHLSTAVANGFPRNAIVGLSHTYDASVTPDQVATLFANRRVVLVWPNQLNYYNSFSNPPATLTIGGAYLAAACAGVLANNPTNQGLTQRQIYSISGIAATVAPTMTTLNKNSWSSKGVSVLEQSRSGRLVIRHGVTTDTSSVTSREFSIVRCQDELFNEIQTSLDSSQLIGTPITEDTPLSVKSIIAGALETALGNGTIQNYANLAVRQQVLPTGDPTVIEAVFSYQPTYPLNYITVTFSFDLSTGDITSSTDDTAADQSA